MERKPRVVKGENVEYVRYDRVWIRLFGDDYLLSVRGYDYLAQVEKCDPEPGKPGGYSICAQLPGYAMPTRLTDR